MKVRIGSIVIEVPTRKDHLLKVPREILALHREDVYRRVKDEKEFLEAIRSRAFRIVESGPEILECSGILCDACSNPLMTTYVWLLILGGTAWGTICEDCRKRYHARKPTIVLPSSGEERYKRYEERNARRKVSLEDQG